MTEFETMEIIKSAKDDLGWQLRVSEIAKTSSIVLSKEQGEALLSLATVFLELAEEKKRKEKENGRDVRTPS